jgi:hypothetical protein
MCNNKLEGYVTLRVKILRMQDEKSNEDHLITLNIYRIDITDLEKKGFLMIKRNRAKNLRLIDN